MTPRVAAANGAWIAASGAGAWAFARALMNPARAQEDRLLRYVRENADTAFGRRYGFGSLRTMAEYQARVPVASYEDFSADIARIAQGEPNVLTRARVDRLVPSSGSVAAAKHVPYTSRLQREFRRAIAPWIVDLYRRCPRAALGRAYWSITPAAVAARPDPAAVPVGFDEDSEYLGGLARRLVGATFAVPGAVRLVRNMEAFRYVTLLSLIGCRDLALVSVWHPSFLTLLLDTLPAHWSALIADVADGRVRPPGGLSPDVARVVARPPAPDRAAELARLAPDDYRRIWPRLAVVSCWADGHAALHAAAVRERLRGVWIQPKGLLATEGVVTVPFRGLMPIAVRSHVFEFLADGHAHQVHELEEGRTYTVVLTTGGGLYRYRLDDRVQVNGVVGRTPSLRFLGKADHVSDLCGEKLSEPFVAGVLAGAFEESGLAPRFAFLAPEPDRSPPCYALFLDVEADVPPSLTAAVDARLGANPQYAWCRAAGQLGPIDVVRAPGMYARYVERCRAAGQRLGDIKPLALDPRGGWRAVTKI